MKRSFFISCHPVLLALILLISCKDVFIKGNFAVTGPEGWLRKDSISKDGCKKVQFFKLTGDTAVRWHENISISVEHSKNLSKYATDVVDLVKKDAVAFKDIGRGDTVINGYKAIWAQLNILYNRSADDEMKEQKVYFLKEDASNIYMIVCSAHKNGISTLQQPIDEVLHSFHIIKGAAKN